MAAIFGILELVLKFKERVFDATLCQRGIFLDMELEQDLLIESIRRRLFILISPDCWHLGFFAAGYVGSTTCCVAKVER